MIIQRLVGSAQNVKTLFRFLPVVTQSKASIFTTHVFRIISDTNSDSVKDVPIEIENPFEKPKPQCILCKMKIDPDYKNVRLLSQFISPYTGRVYGRHITGLCEHKQTRVEQEIDKSRSAGFMPSYFKQPYYVHDPKLYDPENPLRPHKY